MSRQTSPNSRLNVSSTRLHTTPKKQRGAALLHPCCFICKCFRLNLAPTLLRREGPLFYANVVPPPPLTPTRPCSAAFPGFACPSPQKRRCKWLGRSAAIRARRSPPEPRHSRRYICWSPWEPPSSVPPEKCRSSIGRSPRLWRLSRRRTRCPFPSPPRPRIAVSPLSDSPPSPHRALYAPAERSPGCLSLAPRPPRPRRSESSGAPPAPSRFFGGDLYDSFEPCRIDRIGLVVPIVILVIFRQFGFWNDPVLPEQRQNILHRIFSRRVR